MKAMVLEKQEKIERKPLKYTNVESKEIANGQILVRVLANGVCHSDLHIVEGDFPSFPGMRSLEMLWNPRARLRRAQGSASAGSTTRAVNVISAYPATKISAPTLWFPA